LLFQKLHPFVQYKLFQTYCTSLYDCELWLLTNCNIDVLCVAWGKTLVEYGIYHLARTVNHYHLFVNVHHYLMTFAVNHLNFIYTCALHDSFLIRFVAQYGAIYARSQPILDQNVLFCAQHYHRSISNVIRLIVVLMHLLIIH